MKRNVKWIVLSLLVLLPVIYLASWDLAYTVLVGTDYQYLWTYLDLAWTGPGEIPAFIQWVAIGITVFLEVGAFFVLYLRSKK